MLPPKYIEGASLTDPTIRYEWNEWTVKQYYSKINRSLFTRLRTLTFRAKAAMTIAAGEWIVARFDAVSQDIVPKQYFEAAWAGNIDLHYLKYVENSDNQWRGPIRGPLNMAMTIVIDSLFCADESAEPAQNPAWMCALAEHVLPRTEAFLAWRDRAVERLMEFYPATEDNTTESLFGDQDVNSDLPVPPELFDPSFPFRLELVPELSDKYLRGLDYQTNPFLRSPEELSEWGFDGTAYRFILEDNAG